MVSRRQHQVEPGEIGGRSQPDRVAGAAAHRQHADRRRARLGKGLERMRRAAGDPLQSRAIDMPAGVGEVQAEQAALGERVVDRRALAGEIGQHHQPLRARRHRLGLGRQLREGGLAIQIARQFVAKPVGQRAAGGEPRHHRVLARNEPRRRPQPRVANPRRGQRDDEHRRAEHQHRIARRGHADAHRLGRRVDGAEGHRRTRRQPGLVRRPLGDTARRSRPTSRAAAAYRRRRCPARAPPSSPARRYRRAARSPAAE